MRHAKMNGQGRKISKFRVIFFFSVDDIFEKIPLQEVELESVKLLI